MKKIILDYGKEGIEINLPGDCQLQLLGMKNVAVTNNPRRVLKEKLITPTGTAKLSELARGKKSACIVVSDKTRPAPNKIILPPLLEVLEKYSLKIKILIGCGTHAPTTGKDLEEVLGKEASEKYEVINHDANDKKTLTFLGKSRTGVPIYLNKNYCEADLKITTGFIEPHFMAGFSGGRKAICPGIAGMETIAYFHSAKVLESPRSRAGVLRGNPCDDFANEVAEKAGCDFIVNVTLNSKKKITGIFCGEMKAAFLAGARFCEEAVSADVKEAFDVVITTNGGYPLDINFYQTVKGIVAAAEIMKKGGTIIIASECSDGIGSKDFKELLSDMKDTDEFIRMISREGYFRLDQWEVEELIKALRVGKVKLYSGNLTDDEIKSCWCEPVRDLNAAISETIKEYGKKVKVALVPSGPYLLARVKENV